MNNRIESLKKTLHDLKVDCFFVSHPSNIRYLCGFSGSNGLLAIFNDEIQFYTDPRYQEQAAEETTSLSVVITKENLFKEACERLKKKKIQSVGIEQEHMLHNIALRIQDELTGKRIIPLSDLVEHMAQVKDEEEIRKLSGACKISDKAFSEILPVIRAGISEKDITAELVYRLYKNGSERLPFDPIVTSGSRTSLIHGQPSSRKISGGDMILFDFGAVYEGYCSDITRTIIIGNPSRKQKDIYNCVKEAQTASAEMLRAGVSAPAVHSKAVEIISRRGYGEYFPHSLGHGIGIGVHSMPLISVKNDSPVPAGAAVTIEPGIYIPGFGGVRLEDDFLVTENGVECLSHAPHFFMFE